MLNILGISFSLKNLGESFGVAWKGYLALFVAMAIIFIAIVVMNKFLKYRLSIDNLFLFQISIK